MYDLYPDWGPTKNRTEEPPMSSTDVPVPQTALAPRDESGQRPDDN